MRTVSLIFGLLAGHVTCHVTFDRKEPLFGQLPTVFNENIKQIGFLDAGQILPAFHVWNAVARSAEKNYKVKGQFSQKKFDF